MVKNLPDLEDRKAQEVLAWALETYGDRVALASSFGAEDVVLIDLLAGLDKDARVFTLDTGRLPAETYKVFEDIRARYGIKIQTYYPDTTAIEQAVTEYGPDFFYDSIERRKLCCNIRKVAPLKRALGDVDAWITGLRREQAVTRTGVAKVEEDPAFGIVKINPLADWSEEDVWRYIRENNVPFNALHDAGYPSIGCAPCTRAVKPGEDVRAGRWWWEDPEQKECGLHRRES